MVIRDTLPLGCMGNKSRELKLLLPIIEPHITKDTIFVEPFCGSCVVSFNIYKKHNIKIHINDIDKFRIQFYNNMKDEKERNEFYKLQDECLKTNGQEYYYNLLGKYKCNMDTEYNGYIISRTIHSFRYGLYPTTTKVNKKIISENWIKFFNESTITNEDYKIILDKYKDNENVFLYLDPPYIDSYNAKYSSYSGKSYDADMLVIDNTQIYINLLGILKCKCKVLFSINDCALTRYLYKDFIKSNYNHIYQSTHVNIKDINEDKDKKKKKKNINILIISNL
jgi:site-specific DNA-adenine methylase